LPSATTRVLGMGAVAGLRSMAAPAALSRAASNGRIDGLEDTPFAALGSSRASKLLTSLEAGELVADKLPMTPSRTSAPALVGRAFSGAVVGAALFASEGRRTVTGAILGGAAAVAAAYAGERLRALAGEKTRLPDPVVACAEDTVALASARRLLR
jgi:uncharacterized membrane protein